jgi:succinyl-diaminopimelate desuccinylase
MKAGVAVMLALLETLDPLELPYDLAAVFYDGEEGPPERNGLRRVLRRKRWLRKARLAIVLEPTDLGVEMGCNGSVNLEITVPGRSGHAARPWTGVNAVRVGAEWLAAIQHAAVKTVEVQGLAFRETLEITRLRAGNARNVLPDRMLVNLNHRFPPRSDARGGRAARARAGATRVRVRGAERLPPGRVCLDDPLVAGLRPRRRWPRRGQAGLDRRRALHGARHPGVQLRARFWSRCAIAPMSTARSPISASPTKSSRAGCSAADATSSRDTCPRGV